MKVDTKDRGRRSLDRWLHKKLVYPGIVAARGEAGVFAMLEELRRIEHLPREELLRRQDVRLAAILNYAAERSAYYRSRWPRSAAVDARNARHRLAELPFLTKRDLQRSFEELVARPPTLRNTRKTTGGSTGEPVTVLKDRSATAREMAASWLGYGWFGVRIGDRAARFWGSPFTSKRRARFAAADFAMHRIRFSAFAFGEPELERYWRRCLRFRPDYFYGYVSMLETFATFLCRREFDGPCLGLKSIVTTAEVLTDPQRRLLENTLGAPVQNEYGCGELGPIAYECEGGTLHTMSENLLLEVLTPEGKPAEIGEAGELVVTDLTNRAMPLIRYRLGDFGVPAADCPCGRGFPTLARIWGRAYDFVETTDGRRYHGEFFMYLFEDLRRQGAIVERFQVTQTGPRALDVTVVIPEPDGERLVGRIRQWLEAKLDDIEVTVRSVGGIAREPSGKMRVIRNLWRERG